MKTCSINQESFPEQRRPRATRGLIRRLPTQAGCDARFRTREQNLLLSVIGTVQVYSPHMRSISRLAGKCAQQTDISKARRNHTGMSPCPGKLMDRCNY